MTTETSPTKYKDCNKKIFKNVDEFILEGVIYLIPDKYIPNRDIISQEHQKIFKYILANVIHYHNHNSNCNNKLTSGKPSNNKINEYINITEKLFAYCITGYLDYITLSSWQEKLVNNISPSIIIRANSRIIERFD